MNDDRPGSSAGHAIPRLNRLFAPDGKCVNVAVDHGFFGELAFLTGIESMERCIATLVAAGPDAIQLSPGQAPLLQQLRRPKPSLVLRVDVGNIYGPEPSRHFFNQLIGDAIEKAVRLDAACVCTNLLEIPGEPEVHHQCLQNVTGLRSACDRYGMPLMVEPLVFKPGERGYGADGDPDKILPLVRQAVELGADVIKCDPTDETDDWPRVIEIAGRIPVLARGGGRVSDEELFRRTAGLMAGGAAGVVYGRNVIQVADPAAMTQRLMQIVHG
jgi:DhnA family fructose-bisphosphate aldolase class Ia